MPVDPFTMLHAPGSTVSDSPHGPRPWTMERNDGGMLVQRGRCPDTDSANAVAPLGAWQRVRRLAGEPVFRSEVLRLDIDAHTQVEQMLLSGHVRVEGQLDMHSLQLGIGRGDGLRMGGVDGSLPLLWLALPGTRWQAVAPAGYGSLGLTLSGPVLQRVLGEATPVLLQRLQEVAAGQVLVQALPAHATVLQGLLQELLQHTQSAPPAPLLAALGSSASALLHWLAAHPPTPRQGLTRRRALTAHAEQLLLQALAQQGESPPDLDALAPRLGASQRTLQLAFEEHLGIGYASFSRVTRLHEARRQLQAAVPGTTVAAVAMRCGFWHLGRFAQAYRELFGHSPSRDRPGPRRLR